MRWLLQGVCLTVGDMEFHRDILVISSSTPYTVLYVQLRLERLQSRNTLSSLFLQNGLSNGRCGVYAGDSFQIVIQAAAQQKDCYGRDGWS